MEEAWVVLYDTPEDCCSFEYVWIDNQLCADRSADRPNAKYWADEIAGRCHQDSVNPTQDLSASLYDTIEDCCAFELSWMSLAECLVA